jgi:2-oxo-4-hydroxy-4-carboxy--5-ureidoimidazoline (OHCU) decarboxylase
MQPYLYGGITETRAQQIARRIRMLRNHPDLWCGDAAREARVTACIARCKATIGPYWRDKADERKTLRLLNYWM